MFCNENILLPNIQCNNELATIQPNESVKNVLLIGLDLVSMWAREVEKGVVKCVNNSIAHRPSIKKEICKLAKNTTKQIEICAFYLAENSEMVLILTQAQQQMKNYCSMQ